jgi:hypothetical protein
MALQARRPVDAASSPCIADAPLLVPSLRLFPRFLSTSSLATIGYKRLPLVAIATAATGNPPLRLHESMPCRLATTFAMMSRVDGG